MLRFLAILGAWAVPLGVVGCGDSGPAPTAEAAQQALESALDAWKAGKRPADLAPIQVVDGVWSAGKVLTGYSILGEEQGEGHSTFQVRLAIKDQPGEATVRYMVMGLDPMFVYRDEDFQRAMNMDNNPTGRPNRR
jgi:hypothetical protein